MDELKARGYAYGDPLQAERALKEELECAENALLRLKNKKKAFLQKHDEAEVRCVLIERTRFSDSRFIWYFIHPDHLLRRSV